MITNILIAVMVVTNWIPQMKMVPPFYYNGTQNLNVQGFYNQVTTVEDPDVKVSEVREITTVSFFFEDIPFGVEVKNVLLKRTRHTRHVEEVKPKETWTEEEEAVALTLTNQWAVTAQTFCLTNTTLQVMTNTAHQWGQ